MALAGDHSLTFLLPCPAAQRHSGTGHHQLTSRSLRPRGHVESPTRQACTAAASFASLKVAALAGVVSLAKRTAKVRKAYRAERMLRRAGWHPGSELIAEETAVEETRPPTAYQHEEEQMYDEEEEESAYCNLGTHREMLEDKVRTESYRQAIFATCADKVVLEVGCGSGILSVFAAQAGAAHVVAVEANEEMASYAMEVIASNGFAERVSVVVGRLEDVAEEVDEALAAVVSNSGDAADSLTVDVVLSEWMGYMLVCEGMFHSVSFARERWLAPGGRMIPERCSVMLAPFTNPGTVEKISGYWNTSPYGVDMSALAPRALSQYGSEPVIDTLPNACSLLSKPVRVWDMDCATATGDDADEQAGEFRFVVSSEGTFHGLAAWFTCDLTSDVSFCTGPENTATHWEQTLLFVGPESEAHDVPLSTNDCVMGEFRWQVSGRNMAVGLRGALWQPDMESDSPDGGEGLDADGGEEWFDIPFEKHLLLQVA
eukprot:TRINITY_DN59419_c0_g1_i1.p1 TRINITY_DN59419_c0_g1~~TRINITY_DN59419_c0_g1_i1.p1  ORF type:complete len:487 (-),score=83.29 TRINITY_DN59419_c0_g1_i1:385-1845(-)